MIGRSIQSCGAFRFLVFLIGKKKGAFWQLDWRYWFGHMTFCLYNKDTLCLWGPRDHVCGRDHCHSLLLASEGHSSQGGWVRDTWLCASTRVFLASSSLFSSLPICGTVTPGLHFVSLASGQLLRMRRTRRASSCQPHSGPCLPEASPAVLVGTQLT